ncbi:hypothetical protein ACTVZO_05180 [Streptomyces sp. IBSNAI002]|uniref:hypothetical protein n=1 Tax=Streptomyces sp. IBSNAI002 TaxID=3457500 RepID=UPI003FCFACD4
MTPAERLALLGPDVIARIRAEAAAAPPPSPELIAALRRILTRPANPAPAADTEQSSAA